MKEKTEIERLVAGSYSGVRPSEAVEDAVREGLPAARLAPRRLPSMSALLSAAAVATLAVALAFAWSGRAGDTPETGFGLADGGGQLTLPVVARPDTGVVPRSSHEITVHVAPGGRLLVLSAGNEWEPVSLDGFAAHLRAKAGRAGFVVVRADRATPWRWLQWLMLLCAEEKRPQVALAVQTTEGREFRLDATLPTDPGVGHEAKEMTGRVGVRVKDGSVRYACGGQESVELASVARWLAGAKRAVGDAGLRLVGEIQASGATPWEHVARLLAEFRQADVDRVEFHGTALPTPAQRAARTLPPPEGADGVPGTGLRPGGDVPEEEIVETPIVDGRPAMIFDADTADAATLDRAAAIVGRRLRAAGFGPLAVARDGQVLRVQRPNDVARSAEVQGLVERRQGTLEFHLTVEPGAPNYETYWLRLKDALARGAKFDEARDVKPADRARDDAAHGRYPLGLRWYELAERAAYAPDRLPGARARYVLCRNDAYGITHESLREVVAMKWGIGENWAVNFKVKEDHRENLARLTGATDTYLAIIVNGRVHAALRVMSSIRDAVQITGGYTENEAKALAALLASEPLPARFRLVAVEDR